MKINEVCLKTGLTKKAISYYENQGLISPGKNNNSYRDFTEEEVKTLKEISLYRKLDITIKEIREILETEHKQDIFRNIILHKQNKIVETKMQQKYIKMLMKSNFDMKLIDKLNDEITLEEKETGKFIRKELQRVFPQGLGQWLSWHFAPYLNEPLDTPEKYNAWLCIVKFLDDMEEIKIPEIILNSFENMNGEAVMEAAKESQKELESFLNSEGEEFKKLKEALVEQINTRNDRISSQGNEGGTDDLNADFISMQNNLKRSLNKFFTSSGYYDTFIPNMKLLSKGYSDYHAKLIELNDKLTKELNIKYDENMNVIRNED